RSEAAKVLEDLGYFVIDNLPPSLIGRVAELAVVGRDPSRVALVMDARGGAFTADVSELEAALDQLRAQDVNLRIVFLEASDEVLIRRFEATRRRHPVAGERVAESIALERDLLRELRADADLVLDNSAPPGGRRSGSPSRSPWSVTCCASCGPTPTWCSTPATSTCTSCGPRSWPPSPARPTACWSPWPPSASSTACLWTPTWSWTSASCP